jgi:alpha-tubulin suppressor-like RCC1 family protein
MTSVASTGEGASILWLELSLLLACMIGGCAAPVAQDREGDEPDVAVTAQALVGSCVGYCGGLSPDSCYCDDLCTGYGDCCDDYTTACGGAPSDSCEGHCGGSAGSCYCDDLCTGYGDCCDDYVPECRRRVLRMGTGGRQTCAVMFDGGLVCWGRGQYGVLGYGSTANVPTPASAPGDVNVGGLVRNVAAGYYHTCARLSTGDIKCWGRNDEGQLGYPGAGNVGDDEIPASMPFVDVGGPVNQLVAGTYHTCALLEGGGVKCWGSNAFGQLGYPGVASVDDPSTVGPVDLGGSVANIFAGSGFHTCARMSSGALRCWGGNSQGQLGYGISTGAWANVGDNETPAAAGDVPVGSNWFTMAAGGSSNCILPVSGGVKCWGYGGAVLGDGSGSTFGDDEPLSAVPTQLAGEFLIGIGSGSSHHCALVALGGVKCWGYIPGAGIGYASTGPVIDSSSAPPIEVGGGPVSSLSVGPSQVCAILDNGGARCWGSAGLHGYPVSGAVGDDETPADMGNIYFP